MIYASLLVKTNRIARILAGSKKRFPTRKPRFMSAGAQLLITSLLISIEVAVAITMLVMEKAAAELQFPTKPRAILACNTTPRGVLIPLAFIFLLIVLCTLYALKTRNVPENFNEAKFVGFAMYTTCVIWMAFVPIYFGSESKIITMCVCISLSAMVTLVFLFLPKLYIILIHPEKNIRALFTTSKTIRCHIGSRVASAISHKTSSSFSSGPGPPDDYDRSDYHQHEAKPIIRSSSCQTSMELLHVLMDFQKGFSPGGIGVGGGGGGVKPRDNKPPAIGWTELNVTELINHPPKYETISANGTTPSTNMNNNNNHNNKVYDTSTMNSNRIHFNEITTIRNGSTTTMTATTTTTRKKYPKIRNKQPQSTVPVKPMPKSKINLNLCVQCAELENNKLSPIFTIDGQTQSLSKAATISEESLSECSISESCDCKLKSITIRLASPNYKL